MFLSKKTSVALRRWHKQSAILIAAPLIVVVATGILLMLKKQSNWVQPPTLVGLGTAPTLTFQQVLDAAKRVDQAGVARWTDIDRLDVRPETGIVKVRAKNGWEVQIDAQSGDVLQSAYRRSDLIEAIHDGSFFHPIIKYAVFLPAALVLIGLWFTGIYLYFWPRIRGGLTRRKQARYSEITV